MRKWLLVLILALLVLVGFPGCEQLLRGEAEKPLEVNISINKTEFQYDEAISVTLTLLNTESKEIQVDWKLNGQRLPFPVLDDRRFSFRLTPLLTSDYILSVKVNDGQKIYEKSFSFIVHQFPFIGTWRATNVITPTYPTEYVDVVGIWKLDSFELYFLPPNGGTTIKTYSAKGNMDFPAENTWIHLVETEYYNNSTGSWEPWTLTDGSLWAKYSYGENKQTMTIQVDATAPGDTAEYTWRIVKISDAVDSWF